MPYAGNYLHSIYIVLDVVSNLEMIFKVHRRMCIVYLLIYLFFGCVGSSFLCEGFL